MADANLKLELTLRTHAELYQAPELDPLNGVYDERSGIERILDELKANSSARNVTVVVRVPAAQLTDEMETRAQDALGGYCRAQMQQMTREEAPVRRLGIRTVVFGLIFIGGSLLLSVLFSDMTNNPQFLGHLLVEGFLIAGWVALWYAAEIWLFEIWENRSERQYYERLGRIQLHFKPLSTTTDETK